MDDLQVQKTCHNQLSRVVHEFSKILTTQAEELRDTAPVATERMSLLLGTVLKISESGKAVLHLGQIGAVDEMNVLLRTQVELLINICYLQESSDEELNRFLHHDAVNSRIAMLDFAKATETTNDFPKELAARVNKSAYAASEASGLGVDARIWSKDTRNLKQRADAVDQKTGLCDLAGFNVRHW